MRPIFTIHAGEYLVGDHIERNFKDIDVWLPSRDTGVDLLLTNRARTKSVGVQVKFSKDFLATHMKKEFQAPMRACGWWTLNPEKIAKSKADLWIFVLLGFDRRTTDFVIVNPRELLDRLRRIHGRSRRIQSYLWVTKGKRCWEARGLKKHEQDCVALGTYVDEPRDFSLGLNCWSLVRDALR